MASPTRRRKVLLTLFGWSVALLISFPVLWMGVTSFKTETEAIARVPQLIFQPTLENYRVVQSESNYLRFAINSAVVSLGSTLFAFAFAVPAAYTLAFFPTPRTRGTLLWILSTKMMPPVGALVPIYLFFRNVGLLDTKLGLILTDGLSNLPIVIWMLYAFFKDVPREIVEAGRMDGASPLRELIDLLLPLATPGLVSTCLLATILAWNEAFWSLTLTAAKAAPLSAFIASFSSPQGLFYAKLSAASLMAIAPILVLGWFSQKQLVRGLTFGAVK